MRFTLKAALCGIVATSSLMFSANSFAGALNDSNILSIFDQANMADITTARLGLKKANSPEVKALAEMVLSDHLAVQTMGRELGKKAGIIALPPDNDTSLAAQAKAYGELQAVSGADFDRAYLRHEIAFHQGVVDAIKGTLLPATSNAEMKALITKVLPGFEHHLAETRKVADKLGVK